MIQNSEIYCEVLEFVLDLNFSLFTELAYKKLRLFNHILYNISMTAFTASFIAQQANDEEFILPT
jgi:hypothetical protein